MKPDDNERFVSQVHSLLESDSEQLDAGIALRLSRARQSALAEVHEKKFASAMLWRTWVPAGACASAVFALTIFWSLTPFLSNTGLPELPQYESELHAGAATELELLEQLEFAAWMLSEDINAG